MPFKDGYRVACIVGSGAGGLKTMENCYRDLFIHKKRATHPLTLLRFIGSSAAAHVGIEFGVKGPTFATCSACSTAAHAIGIGRDYIRHGLADVAIVGASESVINYGVMRAWQAMHVLSPEGCFPFAKKRNGTVLAEGAGIMVLESKAHAKARGAKMLAELCGFGMTSDSKDMVNPDIEGPSEAMRLALEDAELAPTDIGYLNAHGTATTINDRNETNAIKRVFGKHAYSLAISSTKSMHGHPLGAGGGIEAVACVKAMEESWMPPTVGLDEPDADCDLDYVPNVGRDEECHLRDVQLVRLRRPQRRAGLRAAAGLSRGPSANFSSKCCLPVPDTRFASSGMTVGVPRCQGSTTGVQSTCSMWAAPVASITSRSKPSAAPLAGGMWASAAMKSSSIG